MAMNTPKIITAKYNGLCHFCGNLMAAGSSICFQNGRAWCAEHGADLWEQPADAIGPGYTAQLPTGEPIPQVGDVSRHGDDPPVVVIRVVAGKPRLSGGYMCMRHYRLATAAEIEAFRQRMATQTHSPFIRKWWDEPQFAQTT